MKKSILTTLLAMSFLLFCLPCFAQLLPANSYTCTGKNSTIVYSSSSLTGEPLLNISIGTLQISKMGKDIELQQSVLGNLVSVVKEAVSDLYADRITMLFPNVNVTQLGAKVKFATKMIYSHNRTSLGGSALVNGVVEKNTFLPITCTATALVF